MFGLGSPILTKKTLKCRRMNGESGLVYIMNQPWKRLWKSEYSESESSETELEKSTKKKAFNTKGKLSFIYRSPDMKYLYQKYAPHLMLLILPTKSQIMPSHYFFAVVKTNVNFQVVGVLVYQDETKDMIKKGLLEGDWHSYSKIWNGRFWWKRKSTHYRNYFGMFQCLFTASIVNKHELDGQINLKMVWPILLMMSNAVFLE